MGLGVVSDEIDVADDVEHARPNDLQPEIGHPGDLGHLEQRPDRGGTNAGVWLLADQELTIPVDQYDGDDGEEHADEDGAYGIGRRRTRRLMRRQADGRDDETHQSGGVLEEDRSERRIGRGHHLLDQVITEQFGRRSGLTNRPQKGDPLEHEGKRQHHVADDEMLRIEVRDNGRGGANIEGGSGIVGLKDRVDALGGFLVLDSPPGSGTTLAMTLPLNG